MLWIDRLARDHERHDRLAPLPIRPAGHGRVRNRRVGEQGLLDLERSDVLSARDYQLL
jgi:hypothetical protein